MTLKHKRNKYRISLNPGLSLWLFLGIFLLSFTGCSGDPVLEEEDPVVEESDPVRLLKDKELQSTLLHQAIRYSVLLPESYHSSTDRYPVVYLLHGFGDNSHAWQEGGRIQYYSDRMSPDIVPMIFVMMDGFNSYYVDKYNGNFPYMEMITNELVPSIDSLFRTESNSSSRAVMGYSMGGYGAMILPLINPDIFGISVPLSMSFRTDEQYVTESGDGWDYQWGNVFGGKGLKGEARLTDHFIAHSPFHIFRNSEMTGYQNVKFLIHCGDDEESLHVTSGELHNLMREREIRHEFRVADGGHSWNYWHKALPEALDFISHSFEGIDYPDNPEPVGDYPDFPEDQVSQEFPSGSSIELKVFKPAGYDSTENSYPAIFLLPDMPAGGQTDHKTITASLLNDKMTKGILPSSILVKVLHGQDELCNEDMASIIEHISLSYRITLDRKARVLLANGSGGGLAAKLILDFPKFFGSCFLFDASLSAEPETATDVYYYIDLTDKADPYRENYKLFTKLRENGNQHEYRVSHGQDEYHSFLNQLDAAVPYLSKHLHI